MPIARPPPLELTTLILEIPDDDRTSPPIAAQFGMMMLATLPTATFSYRAPTVTGSCEMRDHNIAPVLLEVLGNEPPVAMFRSFLAAKQAPEVDHVR